MIVLSNIQKKYWDVCLIDDTKGGYIEAALAKDGLLFMFRLKDVKDILDANYPYRQGAYWFNGTFDRQITEDIEDGIVTLNPQFVYQNLGEILL